MRLIPFWNLRSRYRHLPAYMQRRLRCSTPHPQPPPLRIWSRQHPRRHPSPRRPHIRPYLLVRIHMLTLGTTPSPLLFLTLLAYLLCFLFPPLFLPTFIPPTPTLSLNLSIPPSHTFTIVSTITHTRTERPRRLSVNNHPRPPPRRRRFTTPHTRPPLRRQHFNNHRSPPQ